MAFSDAISWIAKNKLGVDEIVNILDEFLLLAQVYYRCSKQRSRFLQFLTLAGVPWVPEKTFGPGQILPFVGITLDTIIFQARWPLDKIEKCLSQIAEFMSKSKVTLRQLQSLPGLLSFACSVVVPGRAFLRRLNDLTIGFFKPHHHIRLTNEAKRDLTVWRSFLAHFNGVSFSHSEKWVSNSYLKLHTDSAGSLVWASDVTFVMYVW